MRHPSFLAVFALSLLAACANDETSLEPTPSDEFAPTSDMTISGAATFERVSIPKGVTVTASGDLVLRGRESVAIAGTIEANGHAIEIRSDSSIVLSGAIRNRGSVGDTSSVRIIGQGDVRLSGADIQTLGDVWIQNDSTLTDADFPDSSGLGAASATATASSTSPSVDRGDDVRVLVYENTRVGFQDQPEAAPGREGATGTQGARGRDVVIRARGYIQFLGNVAVEAQDGGTGGKGSDRGIVDAVAQGGRGGRGGDVRIRATHEIYFGGHTFIRSGRGGDGGAAEATGLEREGAVTAASAKATGGRGNRSGIIDIRGTLGILIEGPLTLRIGQAGSGGDAYAQGARGADAGANDAQHGGPAEARGGDGEDSPDRRLFRNDVGGLANLTVEGGHGGDGGRAEAFAGNGGDANQDHPRGGAGGDLTAVGGDGGDAKTRDHENRPIGISGNGGAAILTGGNGGDGANSCDDPCEAEEGGEGGKGGEGLAEDGDVGEGGQRAGEFGGITLNATADGGRGGDGRPPGSGGAAGGRIVRIKGTLSDFGPSFVPGDDGEVCPPEFGACCGPNGDCTVVSCVQCRQNGGEFQGTGTDCDPDPCNPPGACCSTRGLCTITLPGDCDGDWLGMGTVCSPHPCPPASACCAPSGECIILTQAECEERGLEWMPGGVACAPNPCPLPPTGACCNANAGCSALSADACAALGRTYMGDGTTCSSYPCSVGCCFDDGTCVYISGAECVAQGGRTLAPDCDPSPCAGNFGACCYFNGWCELSDIGNCARFGTYLGHGTTCDPFPCDGDIRGACCLPSGKCREFSDVECRANQGTFFGLDADCTPDFCSSPRGACCDANGDCTITTRAACESGRWWGPGTSCEPDSCLPITGACCFVQFYRDACDIRTEAGCDDVNGLWLGEGTTCAPDPCPPTGACCSSDGSCIRVAQRQCQAAYQGDHTNCDPNPCPTYGACCFPPDQCANLSYGECVEIAGVYQGDGTGCSPNPCPGTTGACCFFNGACQILAPEHCAEQDNAQYLGDGTGCDPEPCDAGACCIAPGVCILALRVTCEARQAVYLGDGTGCVPNPCAGE